MFNTFVNCVTTSMLKFVFGERDFISNKPCASPFRTTRSLEVVNPFGSVLKDSAGSRGFHFWKRARAKSLMDNKTVKENVIKKVFPDPATCYCLDLCFKQKIRKQKLCTPHASQLKKCPARPKSCKEHQNAQNCFEAANVLTCYAD